MYALNINKGTEIVHPDIGLLTAGVAVFIPDYLVPIAEHLRGVVVFERVAGIDGKKVEKVLYGENLSKGEVKSEEEITYKDFVKKYKDFETASAEWDKYKKLKGIQE